MDNCCWRYCFQCLSAMEPPILFVFFLGTLALTKTWAGSHSLRYFITAVTRPELREPWFTYVGYVDDQQFVHFDSDSASQRAEPREPWTDRIDRDFWEQQTRYFRSSVRYDRVHLQDVRGYYNQSDGGVHIFQRLWGCEVSPDGSFRRGFSQDAYDGHDYITLDTETYTWMVAVPEAVKSKRLWESGTGVAEFCKVLLKEECVQWLHKFLEKWKDALQSTDPPSARVTRQIGPDGEVTLRCRAQGFYPAEISLTWLRDGEEQLQDTEFIETRPSGDGTFQKWAAVGMTSGSEGRYTCIVQHKGLPEPLTLKWEPQSSSNWIIVGVIAVVLLLIAVMTRFVIHRKKNSDGIGGDYVQASGNDST